MEPVSVRKKRSAGGRPSVPKPKKLNVVASAPSDPVGVTPGFNLGGRRGSVQTGNFKKVVKKVAALYQPGDLNNMPCWVFVIKSRSCEWIRFFDSSLSVIVHGTIENEKYSEATKKDEPRRAAFQARRKKPHLFLDPTCQGTAFVRAVEVSVNNVPVKSNLFNTHLLHYTRANRIFCGRPSTYFRYASDTVVNAVPDVEDPDTVLSSSMWEATRPFHYRNYRSTIGNRVPVYLDGIWPFDTKCKTLETLDREREAPMYFPPDTTIEIKMHLQPGYAGIFMPPFDSFAEYRTTRSPVTAEAKEEYTSKTMEFQDVVLEYESAELTEREHLRMLSVFNTSGKVAHYDFDIVKSQHCTLIANQSYTENVFQIQPFCRLVFVFFQPYFATTYTPETYKPISGFSQFPEHCTKLRALFAGEPLVAEEFRAFGTRAENHQISKKIYVDYLKDRGIWRSFEEMFPGKDGREALNQLLVFDLKKYMSAKTEHLSIQCEFGARTSPADQQILALTVHPTGRATCRSTPHTSLWEWEFTEKSYDLQRQ